MAAACASSSRPSPMRRTTLTLLVELRRCPHDAVSSAGYVAGRAVGRRQGRHLLRPSVRQQRHRHDATVTGAQLWARCSRTASASSHLSRAPAPATAASRRSPASSSRSSYNLPAGCSGSDRDSAAFFAADAADDAIVPAHGRGRRDAGPVRQRRSTASPSPTSPITAATRTSMFADGQGVSRVTSHACHVHA